MITNDEFDIYGNPIGFIPDDIKKGDVVSYIDARSKKTKKGSITFYVKLVGIWDGEKVEFIEDNEKTIVRTINWLKLEK
jgi:hypothetical protein